MSASLIDQLTTIREEHGVLTPALLVDVARDPAHPLHSRFEWDDSVAAEKWRHEQAGQLLRVTFRLNPEKPVDLRAFTAIRGDDTPTSDYVPTRDVAANPFLAELMLRQMKRDWQVFKRRYDHMAEFVAFVQEEIA